MILCQLNGVKKEYSGTTIFEELSFTIKENERIGLIGRNGSGKTTLFQLISGLEEPDAGNITKAKECLIGSLAQIPDIELELTGQAYLESAFKAVLKIQERLRSIEDQMSDTKEDRILSQLMTQYGALQEEFERQKGYEIDSSIASVVNGLQIKSLLKRTFGEMSGGEKTKIGLAFLLLQQPEILLLDEPTNYLDLSSIEWLEHYIQHYKGSVVVISHDRYFLDKVVKTIADLEDGELTIYSCHYSEYIKRKEEKLMQEFHQYEEQQKKIKKMKEAIKRLRQWANEASPPSEKLFRKAKSMEKALAKIEVMKKPVLDNKRMNLSFNSGNRSGNDVAVFEDVEKGFETPLIKNASFSVYYKDRVAIVGNNGTGKSTLIKMLTGELSPDQGRVKLGSGCRIGYLAQQVLSFDSGDRVIDVFRKEIDISESEARHILAAFMFYGPHVFNKVSGLSGGERMRLRLAILMQQSCNFLLLDEPTNHLDIDSREVLEEALLKFNGTILAVSHDRYFLNALFNRTVWVENNTVKMYEGSFDWANSKRQQHLVNADCDLVQYNPIKKKHSDSKGKPKTISEEINEEIWLEKLEQLEKEIREIDMTLMGLNSQKELEELYKLKVAVEKEYQDMYQYFS